MSGSHRDALAAYIRGHDRVLELDRMRGRSAGHADDEGTDVKWSDPPPSPSFGVGVASTLRFERGPGNLRPAAEGTSPDA